MNNIQQALFKFAIQSLNIKTITTSPNHLGMQIIKKSNIIVFVLILLNFLLAEAHYIKKISKKPLSVNGYAKQPKSIDIPFKKCFTVKPEIEANRRLINFKPSSLKLQLVKKTQINQDKTVSVLQSLRSAMTYKHKSMLIFQNFIMLYAVPNKILIIQENNDNFSMINSYRIEQLKSTTTPFKLYKFSNNRALMVIQQQKHFFLLDDKGYQTYALPTNITISHIQSFGVYQKQNQGKILIAQFNKGLGLYKINQSNKTIQLVQKFQFKELGLENQNYIVDVNLNHLQKEKIYVLDAKSGLIQMDYDINQSKIGKGKVVLQQSGCQAFDTLELDHFVLLCQAQGSSSIIQVYKQVDSKGKQRFQRLQPIYHSNYLTDLQVSQKYYMIFSNKVINVFWNTKKNKLPQTLDTKSQINVPGLETFRLKNDAKGNNLYLYTVQSGYLVKYLLGESLPQLNFASQKPVQKNFTIYFYGSCEEIGQNQPGKLLTCQIRQDINLSIKSQDSPKKSDYGVSASIVIILIIAFLLIIWICLKKYKGLQNQARKILQSYKKRKNQQRRAI